MPDERKDLRGNVQLNVHRIGGLEVRVDKLEGRVDCLETDRDILKGKASAQAVDTVKWISIGSLIVSLAGVLLRLFRG